MSITTFAIPSLPANERAREQAVIDSGALTAIRCDALDHIVSETRHCLAAAVGVITIIHSNEAHVIAGSGLGKGVYRRSTSICAHAILNPSNIFSVPDASLDERFSGNPFVDVPNGIRFYAAAVLRFKDRLPIGTLCVFDHEPRPALSEFEARALQRFAANAMARIAARSS